MNERIEIEKYKEGQWRPRTRYVTKVDDEVIGVYDKRKDAVRAGEEHIKQLDQMWGTLAADVQDELENL